MEENYTNSNIEGMKKIHEDLLATYISKNHDYGDSFSGSLDFAGLIAAHTRLCDKFNRFTSLMTSEAMVNDESIIDTLLDGANYFMMTANWLRSEKGQKYLEWCKTEDGKTFWRLFKQINKVLNDNK